jgi:hypothetical protein
MDFSGRYLVLTRLFQFAREIGDLFLEIGSRQTFDRRFACFKPTRASTLRRLFNFISSLHVVPYGGFTTMPILRKFWHPRHRRMSALGQKRTFAAQEAMSALPQ